MMRIAVVLPAPLGPNNTVMSPFGTASDRPLSASSPLKDLPTSWSSTVGVTGAGGGAGGRDVAVDG